MLKVVHLIAPAVDHQGRQVDLRNYGPTIAVYRFIVGDPDKVAALDAELAALGDRFLAEGVMHWDYLLVTATRA